MNAQFRGFLNFIREQGVLGLAVGFMLGGAVSKLVAALISDIINPLIAALFAIEALKAVSVRVGSSEIHIGDFASAVVDFLVIAFVVYYGVKILGAPLGKKKNGEPIP